VVVEVLRLPSGGIDVLFFVLYLALPPSLPPVCVDGDDSAD
jgi:hypothetical protein